jgi:hypothetical protein
VNLDPYLEFQEKLEIGNDNENGEDEGISD